MINHLLANLLPGPLGTLEQIATEAAGLRQEVRESAATIAGIGTVTRAKQIFDAFSKGVTDRAGTIGDACVARILSEPIPANEVVQNFDRLWLWIDRTTENISREIDRRERKQLFAVALLAPCVSAVIALLGVLVGVAGVWVNALRH